MNHLDHIDFDMLYRLAECVEEEHPFDDAETAAMEHIADCKECYKKFCSLAALMSVTSNSGYMVLSEMFAEREARREGEREKREEIGLEKEARREAEGGDKRSTASQIEGRSSRVMAVISIAIQKIKETFSVRMEQVGQEEGSILFEAPLAIAAMDVSGDALVEEEEAVKKLEDIENERNFVAVDPAEKVLLVQVDARELGDHTAAYLILENGSRIDIPFVKTGAVLKGKIENIPEGEFKLYLEK